MISGCGFACVLKNMVVCKVYKVKQNLQFCRSTDNYFLGHGLWMILDVR